MSRCGQGGHGYLKWRSYPKDKHIYHLFWSHFQSPSKLFLASGAFLDSVQRCTVHLPEHYHIKVVIVKGVHGHEARSVPRCPRKLEVQASSRGSSAKSHEYMISPVFQHLMGGVEAVE